MSERCETDKTPQAKANATDKFNSIARHNQRHCLFDNAATTNQAIFSAIFNSLLEQDVLTDDDIEFVFRNYHEAANHVNGMAGAFFTPFDLAFDAALELGLGQQSRSHRVIDLCAGIGVLAYATLARFPGVDLVCVEINADYVEIGRKLVPGATWVCADVMDVSAMEKLGRFHSAISNPPFGRVASFRGKSSARYEGGEAEYKVIDVAAGIANTGVFIIPQQSAGFAYSGVQTYDRRESEKYQKFNRDTGIYLEIGMGVDTTFEGYQGWKGVSPRVELACTDFDECPLTTRQTDLFVVAS